MEEETERRGDGMGVEMGRDERGRESEGRRGEEKQRMGEGENNKHKTLWIY